MNVQNVLSGMKADAFSQSFLKAIADAYDADSSYRSVEEAYHTAVAALKPVLTEAGNADLVSIESTCSESRAYAADYGFKAGLFCGFKQFFTEDKDSDGGFDKTVCKDLFQEPLMKRHRENYKRNLYCNELDERISNNLDEAMQKHVVSIRCAWDNRIHNAALQGFYCGYRAALSIVEQVKPLATMEHIGKILTTEYFLGYIKSYSEIEQLPCPC